MKIISPRHIIVFMLAVVACVNSANASAQDYRSIDAAADSAYSQDRFIDAVDLYRQSIDSFGVSPRIYYNLGNAYYRAGDLGHAIISYERSLKLDPSDKDTRQNLEFVMTKITDRPEDDSSFLANVHYGILNSMSPDGWAWLSFILFIVLLGTVALYIFSDNIIIRKTGFFGGFIVLLVLIYSLVLAFESRHHATSHDEAVVIVPSTNLNSVPRTPRGKEDKIVPLHEGTKVMVLDSVLTPEDPEAGKWYEVKINNNTRAWVNADDVEII